MFARPTAIAGLYQVNCKIPPLTPSGPVTVTVMSDGQASQPNLTVSVK